jgi:hypothetical protein
MSVLTAWPLLLFGHILNFESLDLIGTGASVLNLKSKIQNPKSPFRDPLLEQRTRAGSLHVEYDSALLGKERLLTSRVKARAASSMIEARFA